MLAQKREVCFFLFRSKTFQTLKSGSFFYFKFILGFRRTPLTAVKSAKNSSWRSSSFTLPLCFRVSLVFQAGYLLGRVCRRAIALKINPCINKVRASASVAFSGMQHGGGGSKKLLIHALMIRQFLLPKGLSSPSLPRKEPLILFGCACTRLHVSCRSACVLHWGSRGPIKGSRVGGIKKKKRT